MHRYFQPEFCRDCGCVFHFRRLSMTIQCAFVTGDRWTYNCERSMCPVGSLDPQLYISDRSSTPANGIQQSTRSEGAPSLQFYTAAGRFFYDAVSVDVVDSAHFMSVRVHLIDCIVHTRLQNDL